MQKYISWSACRLLLMTFVFTTSTSSENKTQQQILSITGGKEAITNEKSTPTEPKRALDTFFGEVKKGKRVQKQIKLELHPVRDVALIVLGYCVAAFVYAILQEVGQIIIHFGGHPTLLTKEYLSHIVLLITSFVFLWQWFTSSINRAAPIMVEHKPTDTFRKKTKRRLSIMWFWIKEAFSAIMVIIPKVTLYASLLMTLFMVLLLGVERFFLERNIHEVAFSKCEKNAGDKLVKVTYDNFNVYGVDTTKQQVENFVRDNNIVAEPTCIIGAHQLNKTNRQLVLHSNVIRNRRGEETDRRVCQWGASCLECIAQWNKTNIGRSKCMGCRNIYTPSIIQLCKAQNEVYLTNGHEEEAIQKMTLIQSRLPHSKSTKDFIKKIPLLRYILVFWQEYKPTWPILIFILLRIMGIFTLKQLDYSIFLLLDFLSIIPFG